MILYRHLPVVPHDIYKILFNASGGKIPVIGVTDIRFVDFLSVNMEFSIPKLDKLIFQGDHPF
jgi:hypothetical protein